MKPMIANGNNPALQRATLYLLFFLFCAILFSVVHGIIKIGCFPQTVAVYYAGSESEMIYPKELPELMESTHVHLFLLPLIYYILIHLFVQTSLHQRWKATLIILTFLNIAGFLVAPYLIRYLSTRYAMLVPLHEFIFLFSAGVLAWFPAQEILQNGSGRSEQAGDGKEG